MSILEREPRREIPLTEIIDRLYSRIERIDENFDLRLKQLERQIDDLRTALCGDMIKKSQSTVW